MHAATARAVGFSRAPLGSIDLPPPPLPRMMAAAPAVQPSTHGSIDLPTYASLQDGGGTPGGRTPRAARRPWGQQVTLAGRVERPGGGDLSLLALHPHVSGGEGLEVWSDPVAGISAYSPCIHKRGRGGAGSVERPGGGDVDVGIFNLHSHVRSRSIHLYLFCTREGVGAHVCVCTEVPSLISTLHT